MHTTVLTVYEEREFTHKFAVGDVIHSPNDVGRHYEVTAVRVSRLTRNREVMYKLIIVRDDESNDDRVGGEKAMLVSSVDDEFTLVRDAYPPIGTVYLTSSEHSSFVRIETIGAAFVDNTRARVLCRAVRRDGTLAFPSIYVDTLNSGAHYKKEGNNE